MLQVRDKTNHVKHPCPPTINPRGKIKGFSKKSRVRFIKLWAKIEQMIDWWFDITFHDQILKDLQTVDDRAKFASKVIRQFMQWLHRNYPYTWFVWKREWMPRLSGIMKGELNPHFHVYAGGEKLSQDDIFDIMRKWVELTGVQGEYKIQALMVALNHRSYRKIESVYDAQMYATKYGTKVAEASGRAWGKVGPVPIAKQRFLISQSSKW